MWRASPERFNNQPVTAMKKTILFILLLTLSACGYVDLSVTDQTKIYTDVPVRKSSLQVAVHPRSKQFRPLTAYFYPFAIRQQNSDYAHLSTAFAQIFRNVWMEKQLFPIMEFQPNTPYEGVEAALYRARLRGADLLILGSVPYFYAGNNIDDTAITIQMDVYAAGSGDLLWSMTQSGRIEAKLPDDYIYFRHEHRLSEGPFNKIIRSIAEDMAVPLMAWLPDPDSNYRFANNKQEIQADLAPAPAPAPDAAPQAKEENLPADDGGNTDADNVVRPDVKGVNLDIKFDFDKATIRAESYPLLDSLADAMKSPELAGRKIIIAGHTDARGDEKYNLSLSKRRADAVKGYLVSKQGLSAGRIETVGYGKSRPLTTGTTEEDMQMNRRVEVRLAE